MKDGVGADFTITPHCASLRMGSWWPSGTVFPPLPASAMLDYQPPSHRRTSARVGRRVRPERHNPNSIATLRMENCPLPARATLSLSVLWFAFGLILGVNIRVDHTGGRAGMVWRCPPGVVQ